MKKIETVCVIGSGVMGSGIAAQVANSGTKVILLDINDEIVKNSYEKLFTTKPLPLSHPSYAENIKLGNLQDNLALIKEADLIIEVIVEKLEVKHKLYQTITKYLKTSAILASNTSTLPLHKLKEKLEHSLRSRFIITHFFNPPRYMELLELVTSDETDRSIIQDIKYFLKTKMGKTVVECNDTPGFIANRIGCFLLELIVRKAIKANLNPYLVDYVFTKDYGFPSTGIFGLYDLIGHDVMNLISESLLHSLPEEDAYHKIYVTCKLLSKMKEQNLIGRKAGAGFYKMIKDENGKNVKQVIDFENLNYKNIETNDDSAERTYISQVMEEFFLYVKSLVPSVTQNKDDIEAAMKLGYSLKYGPFELMDRVENKFQKSNDKNINKIILENDSAFLSLENNNYIFKMKTKMNILDHNVFNLISEAISYLEEKNATMYIFPNGNVFSAGADLIYFQNLIEAKNAKKIDDFLLAGQQAMLRIKYAIIPIIACARGMALGGGAEILLHASHVVLHQNLNAGLVELGLDLIPAFGGTKEMFMRSSGSKKILVQNLRNILEQNKSSSADYFSRDYNVKSTICMHKDLLLKQTNVYSKHIDYCHKVQLPSMSLKSEIDISNYNDLQINILEFFQKIIDKQNITEQEFLNLEREKFLELAFNFDALKKIKAITNR